MCYYPSVINTRDMFIYLIFMMMKLLSDNVILSEKSPNSFAGIRLVTVILLTVLQMSLAYTVNYFKQLGKFTNM